MTSKLTQQVRSFHDAFGVPCRDTPGIPDDDTVRLRLRLIAEEFCEVLDAAGYSGTAEVIFAIVKDALHDNPPEIADLPVFAKELSDLDYVVEGTRLAFGIDGEPVADATQASNLSKLGDDGKPIYRDDGKVTKGPRYFSAIPAVRNALISQGWQP